MYDFDETQSTQLLSVSQHCPVAGGKTVFLARSLRHYYDYSVDVYDDICQSSVPRQGQEFPKSNPYILIYPNPAFDLLQIQMDDEGYLEIFDLNGIRQRKVKLQKALNTINIRDLNIGLYLIRVSTEDTATPYFQKITILR